MLIEQMRKDRLLAMKARNKFTTGVLTTLYSEASRKGLDDGKRLSTDDEVIAVCKKFIKGIDESLAAMEEATMSDRMRIDELVREKTIINDYIPLQMSELELEKAVATFVLDNDNANMGVVMKHLKEQYNGRYDGRVASSVVKRVLA